MRKEKKSDSDWGEGDQLRWVRIFVNATNGEKSISSGVDIYLGGNWRKDERVGWGKKFIPRLDVWKITQEGEFIQRSKHSGDTAGIEKRNLGSKIPNTLGLWNRTWKRDREEVKSASGRESRGEIWKKGGNISQQQKKRKD